MTMWHTVSQNSFVKNFGTIKNQKGWKFERLIKFCMKLWKIISNQNIMNNNI